MFWKKSDFLSFSLRSRMQWIFWIQLNNIAGCKTDGDCKVCCRPILGEDGGFLKNYCDVKNTPTKIQMFNQEFYNKQLCTIVLFVHCPHFHTLIFQRKTYLYMKPALFIISGLLLMHLNVLEKDLFYILLFEWIE